MKARRQISPQTLHPRLRLTLPDMLIRCQLSPELAQHLSSRPQLLQSTGLPQKQRRLPRQCASACMRTAPQRCCLEQYRCAVSRHPCCSCGRYSKPSDGQQHNPDILAALATMKKVRLPPQLQSTTYLHASLWLNSDYDILSSQLACARNNGVPYIVQLVVLCQTPVANAAGG